MFASAGLRRWASLLSLFDIQHSTPSLYWSYCITRDTISWRGASSRRRPGVVPAELFRGPSKNGPIFASYLHRMYHLCGSSEAFSMFQGLLGSFERDDVGAGERDIPPTGVNVARDPSRARVSSSIPLAPGRARALRSSSLPSNPIETLPQMSHDDRPSLSSPGVPPPPPFP